MNVLHRALVVVVGAALAAVYAVTASAHAGPRSSDPDAGATLGDSPAFVRLSFTEKPEVSLSAIRILDASGAVFQTGRPEAVPGDPLSLLVRVRPLERGVYFVSWRIVSAVDGHVTEGSYSFGVRVVPTTTVLSADASSSDVPGLEVLARSLLVVGLVLLLGAASGHLLRFGGRGELTVAAVGWVLSFMGIILVAIVQWSTTDGSLAEVLQTSIGRALIGRAVAVVSAGVALVFAGTRPQHRAAAMSAVCLTTLAAIGVHSAAGHAGAERGWQLIVAVAAQCAHFAAAGIWLGGLTVLVMNMRGLGSVAKAMVVRRFSFVAAACLMVVVATGGLRTVHELRSWHDLSSAGYGRTLLVKIVLVLAIVGLGAVNRWKNVPAAAITLRGLRIISRGELALAAGALLAAAMLGTLAPPRAGFVEARSLSVCGEDSGTTVRVCMTTASDHPGPNQFVVRVVDYDTGKFVPTRRASLRFRSLEDHGTPPSSLALISGPADTYVASGANLALPGWWEVTALIERQDDSSHVPLKLEMAMGPQYVSTLRVPQRAPVYMVQVPRSGQVHFTVARERPGPVDVHIAWFDMLGNDWPVDEMVLTASGAGGPRQQSADRLTRSSFNAQVRLEEGMNTLAAAARTDDGARMRAVIHVEAR